MNDSITIQCPNCGEYFDLAFDAGEGTAEFITDCENCCRPMTVAVRCEDGEIVDVQTQPC